MRQTVVKYNLKDARKLREVQILLFSEIFFFFFLIKRFVHVYAHDQIVWFSVRLNSWLWFSKVYIGLEECVHVNKTSVKLGGTNIST